MPSRPHFAIALSTAALLLAQPLLAFDSPLSEEAVREAYFLGQRHDETTSSFFAPYFRILPAPRSGPYIAEVEVYTPFVQVLEASRRRSMGYSVQQADLDYRRHHQKLYVRVRIDFTQTYGAFELYRSAKSDREQSGGTPLPDYYRDFRVGFSQSSGPSREDRWIEPLRVILQSTDTFNSGHYAFMPEDLGPYSYLAGASGPAYAYGAGNREYYSTGWLVWLEFDAVDVASADASVEVITTDGQDIVVPFDLSRLR